MVTALWGYSDALSWTLTHPSLAGQHTKLMSTKQGLQLTMG